MKATIRTALAVLAVTGFTVTVHAEPAAGFVEFGKFSPPGKGAEFVEVQLRSNLLSLAAGIVAKEQPEAASLLRSVEMVQVRVIGLTKENRTELTQRMEKIRAELDAKNWERNVSVQGKDGEDIAVFTKTRGTEALAGVAITVKDHKNLVLVNIVGDIKPDQVAALGESLNIEPLKEAGAALKKDKAAEKPEKE